MPALLRKLSVFSCCFVVVCSVWDSTFTCIVVVIKSAEFVPTLHAPGNALAQCEVIGERGMKENALTGSFVVIVDVGDLTVGRYFIGSSA